MLDFLLFKQSYLELGPNSLKKEKRGQSSPLGITFPPSIPSTQQQRHSTIQQLCAALCPGQISTPKSRPLHILLHSLELACICSAYFCACSVPSALSPDQ